MDTRKVYTKDMCSQLAQHVMHARNLPVECMKFNDIVRNLKEKEEDLNHPTSWMS
jgi:hypothetical protein